MRDGARDRFGARIRTDARTARPSRRRAAEVDAASTRARPGKTLLPAVRVTGLICRENASRAMPTAATSTRVAANGNSRAIGKTPCAVRQGCRTPPQAADTDRRLPLDAWPERRPDAGLAIRR